jgi:hypothetical protein
MIGATYVDREIISQQPEPLLPPRGLFHVYCSMANPGAAGLIQELARECGLHAHEGEPNASQAENVVYLTTDKANMRCCDHVLLYLTAQTWTRGDASDALSADMIEAMDFGIHVLLVHEMRGMGGQKERHGCDFDSFFSCPEGATPPVLMQRNVYSEIAVPLKGGPWREVSMRLLCTALRTSDEVTTLSDTLRNIARSTTRRLDIRRTMGNPTRLALPFPASLRLHFMWGKRNTDLPPMEMQETATLQVEAQVEVQLPAEEPIEVQACMSGETIFDVPAVQVEVQTNDTWA